MTRQTLDKQLILDLYNQNPTKGKYWVADQLGLNRSSVSTLINKYCTNNLSIDTELERKVKELIPLFPYTGTKNKISNHLGVSNHTIDQLLHKTQDVLIIDHFNTPKCSSSKLTDADIQDVLDGSKLGIGNDQMGLIKGVDGISIRNIRKKLLTKEEYAQYHSIERFYSGDYNAYYNDRGDKFMLNKKYIDSYKVNLDNFLTEIEGRIFNQHIKKIHINNKK